MTKEKFFDMWDADALRRASKTLIEAQGEQFRRAEKAEAEVVRLRTALGRVRQGFLNILDCRRFEFGEEFRYGALHRQEVEAEIKLLDAALGGLLTPATADAEAPSPMDGVWRCQECGEMVEPMSQKWRMAGDRWQHHHDYPIGHVDATYFGAPLDAEPQPPVGEPDASVQPPATAETK